MLRKFTTIGILFVFITVLSAQQPADKPSTQLQPHTRGAGSVDPATAAAQSATNPNQNQDAQFGSRRNAQPDPMETKMEHERLKTMNKERFEALKKDTDKLLALANELKQNVDQSSEDKLSMEVIKKTEEIEKLAKKVREKMVGN